jgi:hypothetical protein
MYQATIQKIVDPGFQGEGKHREGGRDITKTKTASAFWMAVEVTVRTSTEV